MSRRYVHLPKNPARPKRRNATLQQMRLAVTPARGSPAALE